MRVALIIYQGDMTSGGQGVYTYYLARELARLGHEVHIIAGIPYPEEAEGVHVHRLKTFRVWDFMDEIEEYRYRTNPLLFFHPVNLCELVSTRFSFGSLLLMFSLRAYNKLHELSSQLPFDVVHDNQTLGYGILLMKEKGLPVVASIHHPLTIDRRNRLAQAKSLRRKLGVHLWFSWVTQEAVASRLDRILTCSESSALSIHNDLGLPRGQIEVIHYGVDVDTFQPLDEEEKEPNSILFVGSSEDPSKGARYLLEALHPLRHRLRFHLTFIDRRPADQLKLVQRLKDKYRLDKRITIRGSATTEELVRLYCRSQIVACPSLYEGFGLPAVEAMACGVPVVATSAGALSEIVEDGVTGILVPPADPDALRDALRRLLSDRDLCRRMGEAGRQRVVERFTWRRTAIRTAEVYQEVCRRSERTK